MKCEEFEAIGLERNGLRMGELDAALRNAAAEHAAACPSCAALQESWQTARIALQALRETTRDAETPQRVEMRLRHEFRTRHRTARARSAAMLTAWALAAVAVLFASVSWWNWRLAQTQRAEISARNTVKTNALAPAPLGTDASEEATLVADNEASDFTLLPGSLPQDVDDSAIVRVGMQRGALSALGLPVNEERVSDWIQVDLLVGQDGLPKAVRLPQSQ
jgi:anti-sigma factor RsiW